MTTNISVSCCHSLVAQGLLCICHSAELKLQAPQPTPTGLYCPSQQRGQKAVPHHNAL